MTVSVYDHYRLTGEDVAAEGVYRIVGAEGDRVVMLRVADAKGRRANTGEVVAVDRGAVAGLEEAENPDGDVSPVRAVRSVGVAVYWSFRLYLGRLRERPAATSAASVAVAVGFLVDQGVVGAPEAAGDALVVAGALGLAYIGGRAG